MYKEIYTKTYAVMKNSGKDGHNKEALQNHRTGDITL